MKHINRLTLALLIIIGLQLMACAPKETKVEKIQPFQLEEIDGSDLKRVILTAKAAERLNIQTSQVRDEQVSGVNRKVVSYAAVLYDLEGQTWLYTSPAPLTFVRESITIDFIDGDTAVLVKGPSSGTEVVVIGVAELYGTETGVSK
jgi:hypothetical protein